MISEILFKGGVEIANPYVIQAEEDKARDSGQIKRQLFFDAADVISLIQGAWNVYTSQLHKPKFSDRSSLILALAYEGRLGAIQMLPPHEDEFIDKISKNTTSLFPSYYSYDPEDLISEIFHFLGLQELVKTGKKEKSSHKKYVEELKNNAANLYKLDQMLNHFYWPDRYKRLFQGGEKEVLIKIDNSEYDVVKITKTPLFKALRQAFDEVRDNYPIENNIIDALALYILQEKLDEHKADKENPLPIFYVSRKSTLNALKKVIAKYHKKNWFTYKKNNLVIPIYRDADFFILDALSSSKNKIDDLESALRNIKSIKDMLKVEADNFEVIRRTFGENDYDSFSKRINEIVEVEFFNEIWLKSDNYKRLEKLINYDIKINEEVTTYIKKSRETIIQDIHKTVKSKSYEKLKLFKYTIQELNEIKDVIKKQRLSSFEDIFSEFALMRFSLDSENYKQMIEARYKEMVDAVEKNDDFEFNQIVSQMASRLIANASSFENQNEDTVVDLAVLWVFGQYKSSLYELIYNICKNFKDLYRDYQSALLHAASVFPSGKKNIAEVKKICSCIEGKPQGKKYKAKIGLSYIYYRTWHELAQYPLLMELLTKKRRNEIFNSKNFDLVRKAKEHIEGAHSWLKSKFEKEDKEDLDKFARNRKYYYAINNLLYFITQFGSSEDFLSASTNELKDVLSRIEDNINYWQPRFNDTLSLYYLRRGLLADDSELFNFYIKESEDHNKIAIKQTKGANDYSTKQRNIAELKANKYEGWLKKQTELGN